MNSRSAILTLTLTLALAACDPRSPPAAHDHEPATSTAGTAPTASAEHEAHDAHAPHQGAPGADWQHLLKRNGDSAWATDAALVSGMAQIRSAVEQAAAQPTLDAPAANALAQTVEDQVAYLIAHCQLPAEADATLHVLIGRLLSAAAALREDPAAAQGLPQMQQTLAVYPHYFAHPGWDAAAIDSDSH